MADSKKSSISKRSSCYLLNLKQPDKTAKRLKLSFQRTSATVILLKGERQVEASVGFLDVSETGAGVFTPELLHKGAHVELKIIEPAPLTVRGIIAWSMPITSSIHGGKFRCRSGIQFVLDGEEQVKAVQEFVRKAGLDPVDNFRSAVLAAAQAQQAAEAAKAAAPAEAVPVAEGTPAPVAEAAPASAPAPDASPAESTPAPAPTAEAPAPVAAAPLAEAPVAPEAAPAAAQTPSESGDEGGQKAA